MIDSQSRPKLFQHLKRLGLDRELTWLAPLRSSVSKIANFGYWKGEEPFILLLALDAIEVTVIEINNDHLSVLKKKIDDLSEEGVLDKCSVTPVLGDMIAIQLRENYYDLAYCKDVLYDVLEKSEQNLQAAIDKMIKVVRPGGWIIAVEGKIGIDISEVENQVLSHFMGKRITHRFSRTPFDLCSLFESAGLTKIKLDGSPKRSCCYKKPCNS